MASDGDARLWDLVHGERVAVMRSEIDRVTTRLRDLGEARLDEAAIGDWSVREVIAHLVVVPQFYADNIRRGASGDSTLSRGLPAAGTGRGEITAPSIKGTAGELAASFADTVIDEFHRSAMALADELDTDESSLVHECYHPGGIVTASRFLVLFLKELGLHEWDIFEAIDPPHQLSRFGADAAIQAMEEEVASGSLRWITDDKPPAETTVLRVLTSGAVTIQRDLVLEPEHTRLVVVDDARVPAGELRIDAADFALGCSGRSDLLALIADGRAQGDSAAVAVFASRLTGM